MSHLGSSFTSYEAFLDGAGDIYGVDLTALNNSGVQGTVLLAVDLSGDIPYLNVSLSAYDLTPDVLHPQHIHGLIDPETGESRDSMTPTLANDADGDGFVELGEGAPVYGPVLVSLVDDEGMTPVANQFGTTAFIQSYDLTSDTFLANPDFSLRDLLPAINREIVVHGQEVGAGYGEGTEGEINGEQDGYVPILPVAAGEVERIDLDMARFVLGMQREAASETYAGTDDADMIAGGAGDDMIVGGGDDDMLTGGAGADVFVYETAADGDDVIADFEDGTDLVDLSAIEGLAAMVTIEDTEDGALVSIGEDLSMLFMDTEAASLSAADAIL
jgi:hypothetical protein